MLLILASCFYIGKPRNVACFLKKTMVEWKNKLISYELSIGKMSNKFRISNVAVYLRCLFCSLYNSSDFGSEENESSLSVQCKTVFLNGGYDAVG